MKKIFKPLMAITIIAGMTTSSAAQAHAIWFAQRSKQLALIYGVGADDLDSVKRLPLVRNVAGYDAQYKPVPTQLRIAGPLVVVDSDSPPVVVTAVMFNGIWSKTPDGEWVKKGRDEVPNAVISEKNFKYAVHIAGPLSAPLPSLPGQVLQITPVGATLPEKLGEPLKLRILFEGKPVAGARVLTDLVNDPDAERLISGADGVVTIKVRNQGLNVVNATYDGPTDEPAKTTKIEHEATLSFVLAHAPE
jgi:nickel transport protein